MGRNIEDLLAELPRAAAFEQNAYDRIGASLVRQNFERLTTQITKLFEKTNYLNNLTVDPNGEGYQVMGRNFLRQVIARVFPYAGSR